MSEDRAMSAHNFITSDETPITGSGHSHLYFCQGGCELPIHECAAPRAATPPCGDSNHAHFQEWLDSRAAPRAATDLCAVTNPTETWGVMWCGLFAGHPRGGPDDGHKWFAADEPKPAAPRAATEPPLTRERLIEALLDRSPHPSPAGAGSIWKGTSGFSQDVTAPHLADAILAFLVGDKAEAPPTDKNKQPGTGWW